MSEAELKAALDRLFAAPLGDFIALRKSLARELRGQGHAEAAAVLADVHKPTASAWALNQVVRGHKDVIARFLAAADEARAAQRDIKKLRESVRTLSAVSAQVVQLAREALDSAGVAASPTHLGRIEGTLKTVPLASDEERALLALGHLSHDLDLSGDIGAFGEGGDSPDDARPSRAGPVALAPPRPMAAVANLDEARKAKARAERAERERAERAARERTARAADEDARRLEARADEAAAQLASLRQQAQIASRAAQEASARAEAASREASAARDEAQQARARAEQARRLSEK